MSRAAGSPRRAARRHQLLATWCAAAVALASLPADHLPPVWIGASMLPAGVLALLLRRSGHTLVHLGLAAAFQFAMAWLAHHLAGRLDQAAALAATLLPPLAFVLVRARTSELVLGLFLALCMLLIGTILGGMSPVACVLFVVAAAAALRGEHRVDVLRACEPALADPRRPRLGAGTIPVALSCVVLALAVERSLQLLPSPGSQDERGGSRGTGVARQPGLADTFDLGGGTFLDLRADRLVTVTAADRGHVPDDLYLRSGVFQVPRAEEWRVGPLERRSFGAVDREVRLAAPVADLPVRRLELQCESATRDLLFVPPGACAILGVSNVSGDLRRGWFRRQRGSVGDVYEVAYQDLRAPPARAALDLDWSQALSGLPTDVDLASLAPLLEEWRPRRSDTSPWALASAIAAGLQQRCSYSRQEPWGPHRNPLLNFLHGSRSGYCMHFASAAALLLRMAGVPCRIGVGLQGGDPDPRRPAARVFGNQHAHAWVEIPFRGLGWIIVDPTPPDFRGSRRPPGADAGAEAPPTDTDAPEESTTAPLWRRALEAIAAPWPAAALLLLALLAHGFMPRRGARRRSASPAAARPARRLLHRLLRELRRTGRPRPPGMPLEPFAARLLASLADAAARDRIAAAFTAYLEIRFGGRTLDHAHRQRLLDGIAAAQTLPRAPAA